jgi:hypothetical protein
VDPTAGYCKPWLIEAHGHSRRAQCLGCRREDFVEEIKAGLLTGDILYCSSRHTRVWLLNSTPGWLTRQECPDKPPEQKPQEITFAGNKTEN